MTAGGSFGRALRTPGARAGLALLALLVLAALAGPALLPDPTAQPDVLGGAGLPPGTAHPLGTDQLSRDVLARLVSGARISLTVALLSVALAVTIGTLVGLLTGYAGGWVDAVLMRLVDAALAIPRLFLLLLLLAAWERIPLWALVVTIGATGWLATSRVVRAEVRRLATEPFVLGAEALGAGPMRVAFRHLLPNALGPVLVSATLGVGNVILLEAGLSFLGLGVQPPTPSWGGMIFDARETMHAAPWTMLAPGIAIAVTVLAANLVGEALRRATEQGS
jgi:peptide/nickel transport system permease protein